MLKTIRTRSAVAALFAVSILSSCFVPAAFAGDDASGEPTAKYSNWQPVGPSGGDVRSVTIDPRDKNKLFASTLDGTIFTSTDGGATWRLLVNLNEPELILDNLMVDSRDSSKLYASGHRHKAPGGFFRSTDGGLTWKESKAMRGESVHSLTQSAFDPNMLLAGTTDGMWRSMNSGEDWEKVPSSTMPVNIDSLAMDPRGTNTIYAGTWYRPFKTTDGGKNWRLIKDGMIDDSDVFAVTVDPRNPEHIVASACSGIYESNNAGEKWAKIQGIPSQSRRTRDIVQHPSIPGTIYAATTEGFWMSSNGGKSWALTTSRDIEINSIAVHPDEPNRVFIGTNNYGIMVSNDGGRNFVPASGNLTSRFTYFVTPDVSQPGRIYAATHNIGTGGGFFFVSNDNGRTWTQGRNLDVIRVRPFVLHQDATNPDTLYLGTNVGLYRSLDRGLSWNQLTAPAPPAKKAVRPAPAKKGAKTLRKTTRAVAPTSSEPAAPAMLPSITQKVKVIESLPGGGMIVGTDSGLYRTTDPMKGWERVPLGLGINENIFAVHISPARADTIWVGTATSGVLVSRDYGKTWSKTDGAVDNVPVSAITSDPTRPDYIYVGTSQTFYVSRDDGKTWRRRGGNLPLGNFTSILINPNNTNEILLSSALESDGGVYISSDAGEKWKRVDTKDMNLASRRVWSMAYDPHDPNRIWAGTHSSGVYRIERSE